MFVDDFEKSVCSLDELKKSKRIVKPEGGSEMRLTGV